MVWIVILFKQKRLVIVYCSLYGIPAQSSKNRPCPRKSVSEAAAGFFCLGHRQVLWFLSLL